VATVVGEDRWCVMVVEVEEDRLSYGGGGPGQVTEI
jgi:hypothetical protein